MKQNSKELKRQIKELQKQIEFLQVQLAAALANKIVVIPSVPFTPAPAPINPNYPITPYIGDPVWPHNPTITCGTATTELGRLESKQNVQS